MGYFLLTVGTTFQVVIVLQLPGKGHNKYDNLMLKVCMWDCMKRHEDLQDLFGGFVRSHLMICISMGINTNYMVYLKRTLKCLAMFEACELLLRFLILQCVRTVI